MNPAVLPGEEPGADASKTLSQMEAPRFLKEQIGDLHAEKRGVEQPAEPVTLLIHDLRSQLNQHLGNIDLDRADLVASAAK